MVEQKGKKKESQPKSHLITQTQINSKWIISKNARATTITCLEENIGVNLHDLELGNEFLDKMCKAQMEKKKDKLNLTRILKFEGHCSGLNSVLQKFMSTGNLRM